MNPYTINPTYETKSSLFNYTKKLGKAVGTVEMFGEDSPKFGRAGILRIDLASEYDVPQIVSELTSLAVSSFMSDFNVDTSLVKSGHTPERTKVFLL